MSRWVVPNQPGLRAGDPNKEEPDNAMGRITKYIPAEILSGYTALFTALVSLEIIDAQKELVTLGMIALFFAITIGYIWIKAGTGSIRRAHLVVSPIAFLAWAYPISSSLIESYFHPLAAFGGIAITIGLSIFIRPVE